MTKTPSQEPQLDQPGAGLPAIELLMARRLFQWKRKRASHEQTAEIIRNERDQMVAAANELSSEAGSQQVLINRLRGLEDSSRFWSIYMVLDHLRIVNTRVAMTIHRLGREVSPEGQASTAEVKPDAEIGPEVVQQFSDACDLLLEKAAAIENLETSATFRHPWFGPLNASGWFFMAAFHLGLHRKQMEKIQEGL